MIIFLNKYQNYTRPIRPHLLHSLTELIGSNTETVDQNAVVLRVMQEKLANFCRRHLQQRTIKSFSEVTRKNFTSVEEALLLIEVP